MAKTHQLTLTTEDGEEINFFVIKFESVEAYEIIAKMEQSGAKGTLTMTMRKELLTSSYVVRNDSKGEQIRIDFSPGPDVDKRMNRAFKGTGIVGLTRALNFAHEVNFADFLAEAKRVKEAKLAAQKQSTVVESNFDLSETS